MDTLVPDFESLLSFSLSDDGASLNGAAAQILAPAIPALRAIAHDPKILNRAMLDYISLIRSDEATKSREELESRCTALATKHFDLISASRAVNVMRNIHGATIHSLPVELLGHVFITAKRLGSWRPNTQFRSVCRLWRDVYDDTPSLWDDVTLSGPVKDFDQLRRVLDRSKNRPLELSVYLPSMNVQLFSIISSEMARVQDLRLYCASWSFERDPTHSEEEWRAELNSTERLMSQLVESSAPLLQNLEIDGLGEIPQHTHPLATFPRLRSILIRHCEDDMPFTSYIFKSVNLTSVTLYQCALGDTVDEMLLLLKTLPNLEHFEVGGNYDSYDLPFSFNDFGHKSISLPKLACLALNFTLEIIARVISILDFPISTRIVACGWLEDPIHSPEFPLLLDVVDTAFRPHFQKLFPDITSGYSTITVTKHTDLDDEQRGFSVIMGGPENSPKCPHSFDFGAMFDHGHEEEYMAIMMKMLSWPGMAHMVTNICVEHDKFMRKRLQWQQLLGCFPALERVAVDGLQVLSFFRVLYKGALLSSARALQTVSVSQAKAKAIGLILRTLDKRVETGQQSLKLEFHGCDIEAPELALLQLHRGTQEVTWDGQKAYHGRYDRDDDESDDDESDDEE